MRLSIFSKIASMVLLLVFVLPVGPVLAVDGLSPISIELEKVLLPVMGGVEKTTVVNADTDKTNSIDDDKTTKTYIASDSDKRIIANQVSVTYTCVHGGHKTSFNRVHGHSLKFAKFRMNGKGFKKQKLRYV